MGYQLQADFGTTGYGYFNGAEYMYSSVAIIQLDCILQLDLRLTDLLTLTTT